MSVRVPDIQMPRGITHAAAFLLGVVGCAVLAVHRPAIAGNGMRKGEDQRRQIPAASPSSADRRRGKSFLPEDRWRLLSSREYHEAWDAVAHRNANPEKRRELQMAVLRRWSLVDLRAALVAVLDGDWWGRPYVRYEGATGLSEAFTEAFRRDPERALSFLQERELLRGGVAFDGAWMVIFRKDPEGLMKHIGSMRPELAKETVESTLYDLKTEEERKQRTALLESLAARLEGGRAIGALLEVTLTNPSKEPAEVLLERIGSVTTDEGRIAAMADYLSTIKEMPGEMRAAWDSLPEDLRAEALEPVLRSGLLLEAPTALVDIALEAGQTDLLDEREVLRALEPYSGEHSVSTKEKEQWGPWALTLPVGPEMDAIYRKAVAGFLTTIYGDEMEQWLEAIPSAWHRDRALAEMAKEAERNAPDRVEWARERITDPVVRDGLKGIPKR